MSGTLAERVKLWPFFLFIVGVLVAMTFSRQVFGRIDLLRVLNGAIGGLVAITAGPAIVSPDVEAKGQDVAELGIEAFPEFVPAMEE